MFKRSKDNSSHVIFDNMEGSDGVNYGCMLAVDSTVARELVNNLNFTGLQLFSSDYILAGHPDILTDELINSLNMASVEAAAVLRSVINKK